MSDEPQMTYEALCDGVLRPWFSGEESVAGARVATPKEAAARGVLAALNTGEGQKGGIRIIVRTADEKRETQNFLVAFLTDEPRLRAMVRKQSSDGSFHLFGGAVISIETNSARIAKNVIATVVLDPSSDDAIASIWWGSDSESREECAVRHGYTPEQVPQLRFIRWLAAGEGKAAPQASIFEPANTVPEQGPPEDRKGPPEDRKVDCTPDTIDAAVAEKRWRDAVERDARERQNERLRDGLDKISGGFA